MTFPEAFLYSIQAICFTIFGVVLLIAIFNK